MRKARWCWGLLVLCLSAGCGGSGAGSKRLIDWYGTYPLKGDLQLQVSTHGMSQIEYILKDTQSGKVLVQDYSSNTTKWFFYWDEYDRLWAHADNVGTVCWATKDGFDFRKRWLTQDSPLLSDVPKPVLERLPARTRQYLYR